MPNDGNVEEEFQIIRRKVLTPIILYYNGNWRDIGFINDNNNNKDDELYKT